MKQRSKDQPLGWRAGRRKRALELHAQGWSQHRIARALGVAQAAVSRWLASGRWQGGVPERRDVKPRREAKSLRQLPDLLSYGAEVWGCRGELWTCARVAAVIKEEFGVTYSRAHVSRLLKALEWTPPRPLERASQRDEEAIAAWRTERWPELKKRHGQIVGRWCLSTRAAFTYCPLWRAPTRLLAKRPSCTRPAARSPSRSWQR